MTNLVKTELGQLWISQFKMTLLRNSTQDSQIRKMTIEKIKE